MFNTKFYKMIVKTYINGGEIIDSGVTIIEDDAILKFEFPEAQLKFFIKFEENPNVNEVKWEAEQSNEGMVIKLINVKLGSYTGVEDFLEAALFENKKICLKFKVKSVGSVNIFFYKWILR